MDNFRKRNGDKKKFSTFVPERRKKQTKRKVKKTAKRELSTELSTLWITLWGKAWTTLLGRDKR